MGGGGGGGGGRGGLLFSKRIKNTCTSRLGQMDLARLYDKKSPL